jgi:hypothetical protein
VAPADDGDGDRQAGAVFVDLLHRAVEGGERPVDDAHALAMSKRMVGLGRSTPSSTAPMIADLLFGDRDRLVARAQEAVTFGVFLMR